MTRRINRNIILCVFTLIICALMYGCGEKGSVPDITKPHAISDAQYKKEMDEIRKNMKGDLKIRLKKDGKGAYSWEITGKDPHQIIQANETLNKRINNEKRE